MAGREARLGFGGLAGRMPVQRSKERQEIRTPRVKQKYSRPVDGTSCRQELIRSIPGRDPDHYRIRRDDE
jgi:hypothetical protein